MKNKIKIILSFLCVISLLSTAALESEPGPFECEDTCAPGTKTCFSNSIYTCQYASDLGCWIWQYDTDCNPDNCVDGVCVSVNCPNILEFSTLSECNTECAKYSGYSCIRDRNYDCKIRKCDETYCWCDNCNFDTTTYFCGSTTKRAGSCDDTIKVYTDCNDDDGTNYYPLGASCGGEEQACCTGSTCNSGLWCDTSANPDMCCKVGWKWTGSFCEGAAHCNSECPYTPAQAQYWFDSDCIYVGATECCCVTGNYGDPNFKEMVPIQVY